MKLLKSILMVDDEEMALMSMESILEMEGYDDIVKCSDSRDVMTILHNDSIELILLDLSMPHITGKELLDGIKQKYPEIPVVVVTAHNDVASVVECMKVGANDYLTKPLTPERLTSCVNSIIEIQELKREVESLKNISHSKKLKTPEAFSRIITGNDKMFTLFHYMEVVATTSHPVLISGETGVGKEYFAKAIHDLSGRKGDFVAINVAGLDDNVFSDTLFGHIKGAFTGAEKDRAGLIEKASGGTLFLDEIGDLSSASQVKLLRLLQEHEYMPLGSDNLVFTDARVIAATNCDLKSLQEEGGFRKDLFYRLTDHQVHVPPLRERKDDLSLLVDNFLQVYAEELGKKKPTYPDELIQNLGTYSFPGNIRELQKIIFEAMSHHEKGTLSLKFILNKIDTKRVETGSESESKESGFYFPENLPSFKEMSRLLLEEAMRRSSGNQSIAARLLGVSPQALNQKIKRSAEE